MKITKYYCDLCGKEVECKGNNIELSGRIAAYSTACNAIGTACNAIGIEVCDQCMQQFWELKEKLQKRCGFCGTENGHHSKVCIDTDGGRNYPKNLLP